jgi:hypothetical protein
MKIKRFLPLLFAAALAAVSVAAQAAGVDVNGFIAAHSDAITGLAMVGSVSLPNGALVHIASGYGASKTMSAITNASAAVATLEASHGVIVNDIIEVTSGWSRLNNKVVRASVISTNDVTLEGIVSTSTAIYPAGTGTGSVREITGWTQLQQILDSGSNGGEQQFLEFQFLEGDAQVRIPTFKNAAGLSFSIADDPTLAGYLLASEANDDRLQRAVRITLPSSAKIYYNAYISLNKTPSLNVNQLMACQVTLSLLNEPVRYTS